MAAKKNPRTKKASFIASQRKKGRSKKQAESAWEMSRVMKRAARSRKRRREYEARRRRGASKSETASFTSMRYQLRCIALKTWRAPDIEAAEAALREHFRLLRQPEPRSITWIYGPGELTRDLRPFTRYYKALRNAQSRVGLWRVLSNSWISWRRRRRERRRSHNNPRTPAHTDALILEMCVSDDVIDAQFARVARRRRRMGTTRRRGRFRSVPRVADPVFPADSVGAYPRKALRALAPAARAGLFAFWVTRLRDVIALARPLINVGGDRLLHNESGASIVWPNGEHVYCWRGLRVPPEVILSPEDVTVDMIDKTINAELRRVLIERYGPERYLRDGHAILLGEDEVGRLWGKPMWDDEPMVMVEVINSTPEPDGSVKHYWLRVPPDIRTARDGVAWTFEMAGEVYNPLIET